MLLPTFQPRHYSFTLSLPDQPDREADGGDAWHINSSSGSRPVAPRAPPVRPEDWEEAPEDYLPAASVNEAEKGGLLKYEKTPPRILGGMVSLRNRITSVAGLQRSMENLSLDTPVGHV